MNSCLVFPAPFTEKTVFSPLYILAFIVKDKVPINAWVFLWDFHFVLLVHISVSLPVPYCLDCCSFNAIVWSQERWFLQLVSSFSRLFWPFSFFCDSIWTVKSFILVLWKMPLITWLGLHWIRRFLWVV